MKLAYRRDVIRGVRDRWNAQYPRESSWMPASGIRHEDVRRGLAGLNLLTCSAEDVDRVIGNNSWTEFNCDECQTPQEVMAHLGDEPDYDARWQMLCKNCLVKAVGLFSEPA